MPEIVSSALSIINESRRPGRRSIIVDADACPALNDIIKIARAHDSLVVLVGNETQNLTRFQGTSGVAVVEVASERDAADYAIVSLVTANDIVITGDIGLASLVLSKEAIAISARGKIYNQATIDSELFLRHEGQRIRRAGGRTKGPSAYTHRDKRHLIEALAGLLTRD
ncbi:MAG: DUF188 domain-containing protein [Actinobacteria bacterium]|nr:DUF188 domain-containing protein [Actinomycetota bacterium]